MSRVTLVAMFLCTQIFARTLSGQAPKAPSVERTYVGFLDDAREEMANWESGVASQRLIRPAFEKVDSVWRLVGSSSFPSRMTWTVAFNGRNIGHVESQTNPDRDLNKQENARFLTFAQIIATPVRAVPSVGSPSKDFAGLMAMGPGEMRRPLIVVSRPYVGDPDGWKRLSEPPEKVASEVRSAFRRDFPHIERCEAEKVLQHDWKFPDSSLSFLALYSSNKKTFLVETGLNAGDCGYVDDSEDPQSNPWFLVSAEGDVRRIGSFMTLLDIGDYDNDGRSELIFFLSQPEDTDGFILFDAGLKKQVSLTWEYH